MMRNEQHMKRMKNNRLGPGHGDSWTAARKLKKRRSKKHSPDLAFLTLMDKISVFVSSSEPTHDRR